jgi:NNP family nitrate/nitrite transporter-like MFS transporter
MPADSSRFRAQLVPIILAMGVLFSNMLPRSAFSPLLLSVERSLEVSHAAATRIFLYMSVGSGVSMLLSGVVSSRLTHRKTIILSALTAGLSLLFVSYTPSFEVLCLGLFVFGMATGLYPPSGMATITSLVDRREWGKALGLHEVGPNLSMIMAPILVALLSGALSWQTMIRLMGLVGILAGFAFLLWGRGGEFRGSPPRFSTLTHLLRRPAFWILMTLMSTVLAATTGVFSILPTFLVVERGMELRVASALVGISRLAVLVSVLLSGLIVDRLGSRRTMFLFLAGTGLLTVALGVTTGTALVVVAFLQPILGAGFFPASLSAVSSLATEETRNLVYAATFPLVIVIGGGLAPSALGFMGDHLSFAAGIVIAGVVALAVVPLVRQTEA